MKKKVIFVTKALWIGGIETALVNLLNHMDYEKYEITLLVTRAELDMQERINPNVRLLIADRDGCYSFGQKYGYSRLYHLTEEAENPSLLHRAMMFTVPMIQYVENGLYISYLKDLMKDEHFDTCIIYSDVMGETAVKAINAEKFLMYYHHGAMRHVYHDEIAYKACEKIICVSENQAEQLRAFVPKYADKIMVIHNLTDVEGIRTKANEPIEEVFDDKYFHICSVGRVSHEKGMDIAVRTCKQLVDAGYDNIRWWIIGGGPAWDDVVNTVKECGMEEHVLMTGMKSNSYPYIKACDFYVQPSRFEGYPMTILEALVIGQPVISSDNNGAKEILEEGVTGVLSELDYIGDSIRILMDEPEKYKSLEANVKKIDFEALNQSIIQLLEERL